MPLPRSEIKTFTEDSPCRLGGNMMELMKVSKPVSKPAQNAVSA
jgi:hypothetical protein